MAKTSMIARERRREKTVKRFAKKRAELKELIRNPSTPDEERILAQNKFRNYLEMLILLGCKEDVL